MLEAPVDRRSVLKGATTMAATVLVGGGAGAMVRPGDGANCVLTIFRDYSEWVLGRSHQPPLEAAPSLIVSSAAPSLFHTAADATIVAPVALLLIPLPTLLDLVSAPGRVVVRAPNGIDQRASEDRLWHRLADLMAMSAMFERSAMLDLGGRWEDEDMIRRGAARFARTYADRTGGKADVGFRQGFEREAA